MAARVGAWAAARSGNISGRIQMNTSVIQKAPYEVKAKVPKVLFFFHSMMPAIS